MSTPPVFRERWRDRTTAVTVPAGAGMAQRGDVEPWQLAGYGPPPGGAGWGTWTAGPGGDLMFAYDPDVPLEVVMITALTAGGQATVTRGAQDTVVVPHRPGFELVCCISADGLGARARAVPSGQGLAMPGTTQAPHRWDDNRVGEAAGLDIPAGEAARPGSVYELIAFGYTAAGVGPSGSGTTQIALRWGTPPGGVHLTGVADAAGNHTPGPHNFGFPITTPFATAVRWRYHAVITIHNAGLPVLSTSVDMLLSDSGFQNVPVRHFLAGLAIATGPAGIDLGAAARLYMTMEQQANNPAGHFVAVVGGRVWRAA